MVLLLIVLSSCRSTEKLVTPTSENDLASPAAIISISTTPSPAKFSSGWVTFTNGNEQIYDIALDQNGHLWAASQGGLVKWNTSNNTYKKFTTADGLPTNRIDSVFVTNDGIVWVGAWGVFQVLTEINGKLIKI